jgi:hypothetical protein
VITRARRRLTGLTATLVAICFVGWAWGRISSQLGTDITTIVIVAIALGYVTGTIGAVLTFRWAKHE